MLAIQMLRQYPTQIEADLRREYGIRIRDWYRGDMTSRELMVLCEELSDDSSLMKALSPTGWPEWVQILAEHHKEAARYYGAKLSRPGQRMDIKTFIPPKDRMAAFMDSVKRADEKKDLEDDLAQYGWV